MSNEPSGYRERRKTAAKWVKRTIVAGIVLFVALCGVATLIVDSQVQKQREIDAAEAARVAADPISADGVYNKVNDERQKGGVARLSRNADLSAAAQKKCDDMNEYAYYEHVNPKTGRHGYDFASDALKNEKYTSENLNQGTYRTNQDFVNSWMGSEAHKAAILDPKYTDTGVAICEPKAFPDKVTMVQLFASFYTPAEVQAAQPPAPAPRKHPTTCYTMPSYVGTTVTTQCY